MGNAMTAPPEHDLGTGTPKAQVMIAWFRAHGWKTLGEMGVNFLLPFLIYSGARASLGEVGALLASSAPPIAWSIVGFARDRRIDALSMIVLVGIALSLLAFVGGGSVKFLQMREKLVTVAIGLAFLGSAAIGRPLIYPLARATMLRRSAAEAAAFEARRDDAAVRHTVMVMTLGWGFGLLADAALCVGLIFLLSIEQYLIVGPIVGYASIGGLSLWTMWYQRRRTRHVAAARTSAPQSGPTAS
jgi:hypothetical protein